MNATNEVMRRAGFHRAGHAARTAAAVMIALVFGAMPALAQTPGTARRTTPGPSSLGTTVSPGGDAGQGATSTPAPVSRIPLPVESDGAPSMVPGVVSPPGGDAPSGPANATPYSAGPAGAGIVPGVGATPSVAPPDDLVPGTTPVQPR